MLVAAGIVAVFPSGSHADAAPAHTQPVSYFVSGDVPFFYGKYYTGSNGLEIRLNSRGTQLYVQDTLLAATAVTGGGFGPLMTRMLTMVGAGAVSTAVVSSSAGKIAVGLSAFTVADLIRNHLSDWFYNDLLANNCLGFTVPYGTALEKLTGLGNAVVNSVLSSMSAWLKAQVSVPRVWFEHCAGAPAGTRDNVTQPPAPAANPADIQPAVPAQPIVPAPAEAPASSAAAPVVPNGTAGASVEPHQPATSNGSSDHNPSGGEPPPPMDPNAPHDS